MKKPTKNPGKISFEAIIEGEDSGAWISFPYDLMDLYGIGNLVPAIMSFDGIIYRGSIAKMGRPYPMLLIKKEIRRKLGKTVGDKVAVSVELDASPREVKVPKELSEKLSANPSAKEIFERMAFSHRREYSEWVNGAKQAETRQGRAEKAVQTILEKSSVGK